MSGNIENTKRNDSTPKPGFASDLFFPKEKTVKPKMKFTLHENTERATTLTAKDLVRCNHACFYDACNFCAYAMHHKPLEERKVTVQCPYVPDTPVHDMPITKMEVRIFEANDHFVTYEKFIEVLVNGTD